MIRHLRNCMLALLFLAAMGTYAHGSLVDLQFVNVSPGKTIGVTMPNYAGRANAGIYNLLVNGEHFDAFCIEDQIALHQELPYTFSSIASGSLYEQAAWLASSYIDPTTDNSADAAVAQMAIWEIVMEDKAAHGWGTEASNGVIFTSSSVVSNAANTLLESLAKPQDFDLSQWSVARNGDSQDFLVHRAVPIPGAVWLLGSGLLGLMGFRRRFRNSL